MPESIRVKKGFDIRLQGEAELKSQEIKPETYAIKPTDFVGVFPKLLVAESDKVKAGTQLFYDKYRDNIHFTSPVSGTIKEIRRGAKRLIQEIVITADNKEEFVDFGTPDLNSMNREEIVELLMKSGAMPLIKQRPYGITAYPDDKPKAIFVTAFDTSPLAPDYTYILKGQEADFQKGLEVLKKLTPGDVILSIKDNKEYADAFSNFKNVSVYKFSGPHPAGNVGTQINKISPLNKGEIVWYLRMQEVITIGKLFSTGKFDPSRIIALTGSGVNNTYYVKTKIGAYIESMLKDNVKEGHLRFISGNVLTGSKIEKKGYLGFYDSQLTVIPEGDHFEFFGWALPGLKKLSFSKTFPSFITPRKKYALDTNLNGGERAFVMTGQFEKVFPFNIYPMQLIKAIMIEDIDLMENLGIYEVEEEDFALCEFIDTSKTEIQSIVRHGLDLMRKEMM